MNCTLIYKMQFMHCNYLSNNKLKIKNPWVVLNRQPTGFLFLDKFEP